MILHTTPRLLLPALGPALAGDRGQAFDTPLLLDVAVADGILRATRGLDRPLEALGLALRVFRASGLSSDAGRLSDALHALATTCNGVSTHIFHTRMHALSQLPAMQAWRWQMAHAPRAAHPRAPHTCGPRTERAA